jgi:hypothetical protein
LIRRVTDMTARSEERRRLTKLYRYANKARDPGYHRKLAAI